MVSYDQRSGAFGPGSDGAVTLDGTTTYNAWSSLSAPTYTMTRDVFATTLTINSGITLAPNGFRIYASQGLVNNGTITGNGFAATGTGAATYPATVTGPQGTCSGPQGGLTTGAQSPDLGGGLFIGVGTGGAGGSGASGAGGAQAAITAGTDASLLYPPSVLAGMAMSWNGSAAGLKGSPGGSSGGGDTTNRGGGGGGGALLLPVWALSLVNNGTISANGGNGGTAPAGNAGGGGGGGGGVVALFTGSAVSGTGTISAAGGTHGAGHGTGAAGSDGGAGTVIRVVLK